MKRSRALEPNEFKSRMSLYDNVLADLCARFVINSPQESFQSWERLLFEVKPTQLAARLWVIA